MKIKYCKDKNDTIIFTLMDNILPLKAPVWEVAAGKRIDDLLESFIGIRDQDLGKLR